MTTTPDPQPAYTVRQVARRLQVDPDVVRGWCRSGALRAINVGQGRFKPRFRVTPEALEAFELARTIGPPPAKPRRKRRGQTEIIEYF